MVTTALFVDLPNFYSRLLKSGIEEPRFLRDYFLNWLDYDLLAKRLAGTFSGIWVFYSGERIGPSSERIAGEYLRKYINRVNALEGVTARNVNIPGEQREPGEYRCEECGHEGISESKSEKGVDASLIVHLFDTMDSWDIAYLLSGDADYVPAVASLRRRGKIVIGAGFSDASPALVRECYDYIDLCDVYLREDVAAHTIFRESDGIVHKWLTEKLHCKPGYTSSTPAWLEFGWRFSEEITSPYFSVVLTSKGSFDFSTRHEEVKKLQSKFPNCVIRMDPDHGSYELRVNHLFGIGVKRRLESSISQIEGLHLHHKSGLAASYRINYEYNQDENRYNPVVDSNA